jgi:protein-S-isoprenylcysteine O-methyltransferase Ste14
MQPKIKPKQLLAYLFIFVIIPLLTFIIGNFLDNLLELPRFPPFPLNLFLGIYVMIFGLNIGIKSTRQLYDIGGGLPWGEVSHEVETNFLVTDGIYRYSRNPMVLGYSLLPVGMGLMFQSLGMTLSITPIVILLNIVIVKVLEEPRLFERFGEDYLEYRKSTSFLFPNWISFFQDYVFPYISENLSQLFHIFLAELSLFTTTLIVFNRYNNPDTFFMQGIISSASFALICILGIIAGVVPNWLSFGSRTERHGTNGVIGHHPDCGKFEGHVVRFMDKNYCAGCSGLVLGAFTALLGLSSSIFDLFTFDFLLVFWIGALFVSFGLVQHLIDLGSGWLHLWINFWFVVGAWFMFESIQQINKSFHVTLYFLAVTLFWIYLRIKLSQLTHFSVCRSCFEICELRFE